MKFEANRFGFGIGDDLTFAQRTQNAIRRASALAYVECLRGDFYFARTRRCASLRSRTARRRAIGDDDLLPDVNARGVGDVVVLRQSSIPTFDVVASRNLRQRIAWFHDINFRHGLSPHRESIRLCGEHHRKADLCLLRRL